jgi:hypothetical protein
MGHQVLGLEGWRGDNTFDGRQDSGGAFPWVRWVREVSP